MAQMRSNTRLLAQKTYEWELLVTLQHLFSFFDAEHIHIAYKKMHADTIVELEELISVCLNTNIIYYVSFEVLIHVTIDIVTINDIFVPKLRS